jgi:hypothetical protein
MLRFFSLIVLLALFTSCHNCICALSEGLRLGLISFDSTEIDTMIIRKFDKGSNFSHLIDTSQWDRSKVAFYSYNDTFQMGAFLGGILLQSKFDYQVFIPAVNRTINITEINEPQLEGDCRGKVACGNIITSVRLNSDLTPTTIQNEILFLKK